MKKTIKDLDIDKIEERHLIMLSPGTVIYRRTDKDPLVLRCSRGTFTTQTPLEVIGHREVFRPTANASAAFGFETMYKETERYIGNCKVYEIKITKEIGRILDLNQVCAEQNIEEIYLKPEGTYMTDEEELMAEQQLHNLYDKDVGGKKLNGVKYRSRQHSEGQCVVFYDNIRFVSSFQDFLINKIKKVLSQLLKLDLNPQHRFVVANCILSLSARVLYDYMSYEDLTDRIQRFGDKIQQNSLP